MVNLRTPGSYTRRENNVNLMTGVASTSVAGFVGVAPRGTIESAVRITSWTQFVEKFAKGNMSPFSVGKLAYGVYNFFNNGGTECYIARVLGTGNAIATKMVPVTDGATYTAKDSGAWGNDITVDCYETTQTGVFNLKILMFSEVVEELKNLTEEDFEARVNSESAFVNVEGAPIVGTGALEGGVDGLIVANDFVNALQLFNVCEDVSICAIPGETATGVQEGLLAYCATKGDKIAINDCPKATVEEIQEFKSTLAEYNGALYYPRIGISDPLTGEVTYVGHSGAIAGLYAKTDADRGVHKAPAGLDAVVKGAVSVETELSHEDIGLLNDQNINCIVAKRNNGIVVWGARLLKPNAERQYVSDLRLDMFMEKSVRDLTEQFVFEPKDDALFTRVTSVLTTFLLECWNKGMLLGETTDEAFYVKCDRELNPDTLSSTLNAEIGYAKKKPSEFVVTKVSHKQAY